MKGIINLIVLVGISFLCLVQCKSIAIAGDSTNRMEVLEVGVNLDIDFELSNDAKLAIEDFENMLHKIDPNASPKVRITSDLSTIPDKLAEKRVKNNRQAYYIYSDTDNSLSIYAIHSLGIQHGLYGYLTKLGYRWYFPGELWTKVPVVDSWYIKVSELGRPDFRGRRFFGGGGYPREHVADPDNYVMNSWETWTRRNRFGAEYVSKPHAWQDFIRRNKEQILRHPEYVSKSGNQLCVSNKGLQELFIKDRINRIHQNRERYGAQDPNALTVGVDPNDGSDHCDCYQCKELGSISNRVFYLANVVARAISQEYSTVKVSVMAYNEHAAPPDFDLERNIQVSVVPYAFQDVAAPEELIKQWSIKHHDIQVRDYWGLVIWRSGKPVINFMDHAQIRMSLWDKLGVNMILVESTYGIGVSGIPLYLLSQIGWDKYYDADKGLSQMFVDLYGSKSGKVMQNIMQRWSDNGLVMKFEQSLTPPDFQKALSLAKTEAQVNRINSYMLYFDYLQLQENVKSTKAESQNRRQLLAELIEYSYSIMDKLMVHSYYDPVTMTRIYDRKSLDIGAMRIAEKNKGRAYYAGLNSSHYAKNIHEYNNDDLNRALINLNVQSRNSSNLKPEILIPNRERIIKTGKSFTLRHTSSGPSVYPFDIEITKRRLTTKRSATIISLYNASGEIVTTKKYRPGQFYKDEKIYIPKEGAYEIRIRSSNVAAVITWKKSQGIELVPGTLVDFGDYYIVNPDKKTFFLKAEKDLYVYNGSCETTNSISQIDSKDALIKIRTPTVVKILNNLKIFL